MKKVLLLILVLGFMASLAWIDAERYLFNKESSPIAASVNHPNTPPVIHPPPLMATSEWPKYRDAREAAFEANPSLQSEYNEILKDMDAQQAQLDAAMAKADPKVTPVIAKLVALRRKNAGPSVTAPGAVPGKPVANTSPMALTQDDMQELRLARTEALRSDPDLVADSKKTMDKMRLFENKLDAAMVKVDPSVSVLIAKFEAGRKPLAATVNSLNAK